MLPSLGREAFVKATGGLHGLLIIDLKAPGYFVFARCLGIKSHPHSQNPVNLIVASVLFLACIHENFRKLLL